MSTTVESRSQERATQHSSQYKLSFFGVIRSEMLKWRSLMSSWVLVIVTVLLMVGMAMLAAWGTSFLADEGGASGGGASGSGTNGGGPPTTDLTDLAVTSPGSGISFAFIIIGALGVTFLASEFATKGIISTFTSAPRRGAVYVAKMLIASVVAAITGLISVLLGWLIAQPFLTSHDLTYGIGEHSFWRVILGVTVIFLLTSWMGLGLGALIRNNAGGIVVVVVLLFVLPLIFSFFPWDWANDFQEYLPMNLATTATQNHADPAGDGPNYAQAIGWYAVWCVVPLIAGLFSFARRDPK